MTGKFGDLTGRNALVTGAAGGIGSAIVDSLWKAGANVIATDVEKKDGSDDAFIACDLASVIEINALVEELENRCDDLDIFVHACGITNDAVLWKMTDTAWREVMAVNLDSAFLLLKRIVPMLRRSEAGSVVLVSSINGERGKFGQANYSASKAGLIALAKTAAQELGKFNVRVNAIAPGLIDTEMTRGLPEEMRARAIEETPLGRSGQPEDVASATLFLASDAARHITGQVLRVDGGQLTG